MDPQSDDLGYLGAAQSQSPPLESLPQATALAGNGLAPELPMPGLAGGGPMAQDSVVKQQTSPLRANDADSMEHEWVQTAKRIMNNAHGDPFAQNSAIALLRAEYINKRYNKIIKTSQSS